MKGFRKSIPRVTELSVNDFSKLMSNNNIVAALSEKTDGFAIRIGWDEIGFYMCSANSPKMRNYGDFISWGESFRLLSLKTYDPLITSRLDMTLNIIKSSFSMMKLLEKCYDFLLHSTKLKPDFYIQGEFLLKIDGTELFSPGGTTYMDLNNNTVHGCLGSLIIHKHMSLHIYSNIINHFLYKKFFGAYNVYDDIHYQNNNLDVDISSLKYQFDLLDIKKLKSTKSSKDKEKYKKLKVDLDNLIYKNCPTVSKYMAIVPEGWILHFDDGMKIKVMSKDRRMS